MLRTLRNLALLTLAGVVVMTAPQQTSAQDRYSWHSSADIQDGGRGAFVGIISDLNSGNNELTVTMDGDRYGSVIVQTDTLSTIYNGFGGMINGSPEVFTGTSGFSNLREGDRVEVHGTSNGHASVVADQVTLLGRSVDASTTGVGQTHTPYSISTPTANSNTPSSSTSRTRSVLGIVRQVSADGNTLVVETERREMITIRGGSSTPVSYQGRSYQLSNLEVGDRIRADIDPSSTTLNDIRARSIEVVESVSNGSGPGRQVGGLSGRVTNIDRTANTIRVDAGRGEVRVTLSATNDASGRRVRASDFQLGDQVELAGAYNGQVFMASSARFSDDGPAAPGRGESGGYNHGSNSAVAEYVNVTIYGTVSQSLRNAALLSVRDTKSNRTYDVMALDDFAVRTKGGAFVNADTLKEGDAVTIKAYRDPDGSYIAQTIRIR